LTKSNDFVYSSVPGPENGFDFGFAKVTRLATVGGVNRRSVNLFFVTSLNGFVTFNFLTGKGFVEYPD
jgi:hypothetical protein